jgi:hypothetical protein
MTWGYDADVMRFLGPVGQGNIQDHAKALNRDISQERWEEYQKYRPIIFIAHSLGGLIVKAVSCYLVMFTFFEVVLMIMMMMMQ